MFFRSTRLCSKVRGIQTKRTKEDNWLMLLIVPVSWLVPVQPTSNQACQLWTVWIHSSKAAPWRASHRGTAHRWTATWGTSAWGPSYRRKCGAKCINRTLEHVTWRADLYIEECQCSKFRNGLNLTVGRIFEWRMIFCSIIMQFEINVSLGFDSKFIHSKGT